MFEIRLAGDVARDLRELRAFDRKTILDAIEKSLAHEPLKLSKNRNVLVNFGMVQNRVTRFGKMGRR